MSLPEKNDYNTLGGELTDYSPVADSTTDLSAEASNEMRSDVAAMTQTCIKAWCGFTVAATVPTIGSTEQDYGAVYGRSLSYKPSIVRNSNGVFTITFPSSIVDARGNEKNLNIQCGFGNSEIEGITVSVRRNSANSIIVYTWNIENGQSEDPITYKTFAYIL